MPFIGPFTGAEFLRNPYNRYVVNIRASYFQETEAWIEHLTKDLGISKIAILYQDDAFGLAGLEGVKMALAKRNMALVASGTFKRNTTAVKSALLDIMKGDPQAVVTVGPYQPIAEFVKLRAPSEIERSLCRNIVRWIRFTCFGIGKPGRRRCHQPGRSVPVRQIIAFDCCVSKRNHCCKSEC